MHSGKKGVTLSLQMAFYIEGLFVLNFSMLLRLKKKKSVSKKTVLRHLISNANRIISMITHHWITSVLIWIRFKSNNLP